MPDDMKTYRNPLVDRYAGRRMLEIWSPSTKHRTWRRLWLALAKAEKKLGLPITDAQIKGLEAHLDDLDFARAAEIERETRHDVMSHVRLLAEACPEAAPIIHLGATSCFVTDNTELIQIRRSLEEVRDGLVGVVSLFADFAERHKDLPTLGFTHYQPAQLTTVGKRFSLYLQDFLMDLEAFEELAASLPARSVKGTTGTQASFLALFDGDHSKVVELERLVAEDMGFERILDVCGQTYTRKIDYRVLSLLSGVAQSAHKFACDIRLLSNLREVEEPFGGKQIGSSAMAYKRNPMRCERVCALARLVISLPANCANTHATQWFERTLDDSANRRIVLPEAFLAVDAILALVANVMSGLVVWPKMIAARVRNELPFMATENILMAAVKAGGDRQELHEAIREHSMAAVVELKEGRVNDLLERLGSDPRFAPVAESFDEIMDPKAFVGRAPEQVVEFILGKVRPLLMKYGESARPSVREDDVRV